jgi:preprotein translocase subunit SecY
MVRQPLAHLSVYQLGSHFSFLISLFFFSYFFSACVSKAKMRHRELQKEPFKHPGRPGPTKTYMDTELLTAVCLCNPGDDPFSPECVYNPAR